MKISKRQKHHQNTEKISGNRKGVALVMVLTVSALASIMILSFFGLATSEHRSSTTYAYGLQAQQIGEQAVNMVIGQIRMATTAKLQGGKVVNGFGAAGTPALWASQPGMIRVWNEKGNQVQGYKLYSDEEMIEPFATISPDSELIDEDFGDMQNWASRPSEFVDLNEPVIRGEKVYFPIVDVAAEVASDWRLEINQDRDGVEGFHIWGKSGDDDITPTSRQEVTRLSDYGPMSQNVNFKDSEGRRKHAPMPVKWIYQLQDGTMGTLTGSGGNLKFKSFGNTNINPTKDNQISSRFAFWADDESSKVNANTSAGGLAWDTPRVGGALDRDMAQYQPARNEWQRYPGHPATIHLASVLVPGLVNIAERPEKNTIEELFDVVPRIVPGGSESGSRWIRLNDPKEKNGLIKDDQPLFSSIDDMIMDVQRNLVKIPDNKGRTNRTAEDLAETIERARFFMTVNGRSPETTPFGTPKVAMWPLFNTPKGSPQYRTKLTEYDRLIHFCASMGKSANASMYPNNEYIFKRQKADSNEFDYKNITRNRQLMSYLEYMLSNDVPGYGASFFDSMGQDNARQVLTEIFDYIRSTNLSDDSLYDNWEDGYTAANTNNFLTYTNPRRDHPTQGKVHHVHKGHGQVTPIKIDSWGTKGFGRIYTIKSVGVYGIAMASAEPSDHFAGTYYRSVEWQDAGGGMHVFGGMGDWAIPGIKDNIRGGWYNGRDPSDGSEGLKEQFIWSTIPPMPAGITPKAPWDYSGVAPNNWPQFMKDLFNYGKDHNTNGNVTEAERILEFLKLLFYEPGWNWNLLYLDSGYNGPHTYNRNSVDLALYDIYNSSGYFLRPGEKMIQSMLLFDLFSPSHGWTAINPDLSIDIKVDGLEIGGEKLFTDTFTWETPPHAYAWGVHPTGARLHYNYTVISSGTGRWIPFDTDHGSRALYEQYDLVTRPFRVDDNKMKVTSAGTVTMAIKVGGADMALDDGVTDAEREVQTLQVRIPTMNDALAPKLYGGRQGVHDIDSNTGNRYTSRAIDPFSMWALGHDIGNIVQDPDFGGHYDARVGRFGSTRTYTGPLILEQYDSCHSVGVTTGDYRITALQNQITALDPTSTNNLFNQHYNYGGNHHNAHDFEWGVHSGHTLIPSRILPFSEQQQSPNQNGRGSSFYGASTRPFPIVGIDTDTVQLYGDFDNGIGILPDGPYINKPDEGNIHGLASKGNGKKVIAGYYADSTASGAVPYFSEAWKQEPGGPAYFSPNRIVSGPGMFGSLPRRAADKIPWETLLFRPNVSGNGYMDHPGRNRGPGVNVPDHVLMEYFWMPVVEPYAISEPISSAGKVNLNFQILPFRHIERSTAFRAALKSEYIVCVPNEQIRNYKARKGFGVGWNAKSNPNGGMVRDKYLRAAIVESDTADFMVNEFFNKGKAFKTSSQLCEVPLITEEVGKKLQLSSRTHIGSDRPTAAEVLNGTYAQKHAVVGDNSREKPYTNIQAKVTTKSNTFKVHYRAQVVKQANQLGRDYSEWDPELDTVQAEYRGSSIVEMYVEPNDKRIPDYADGANPLLKNPLAAYYRFRVVNPTRFSP